MSIDPCVASMSQDSDVHSDGEDAGAATKTEIDSGSDDAYSRGFQDARSRSEERKVGRRGGGLLDGTVESAYQRPGEVIGKLGCKTANVGESSSGGDHMQDRSHESRQGQPRGNGNSMGHDDRRSRGNSDENDESRGNGGRAAGSSEDPDSARCLVCERVMQYHERYCSGCGWKRGTPIPGDTSSSEYSDSQCSEGMRVGRIKCPYCGVSRKNTRMFCSHCGKTNEGSSLASLREEDDEGLRWEEEETKNKKMKDGEKETRQCAGDERSQRSGFG